VACTSAITQARIRLGVAPLKELFWRVARPVAEPDTPGAWYRGHRLVSIDGTTLDLPDVPDLEVRFGRPKASRGVSAFPQMRVVTLVETAVPTPSSLSPPTATAPANCVWPRNCGRG
jgi:hypothetical protein